MRHVIILLALTLLGCEAPSGQDATNVSASLSPAPTDLGSTNGCDPSGAPFGGGSGAQADPWLICSQAQMAEHLGGGYAKLTIDLDYAGAVGFVPIQQNGTIDGGGHTIKNFTYDGRALTDSAAFFSQYVGTLKNLTFDHASVWGKNGKPAAIVAAEINSSVFDHIVVTHGYFMPTATGENGGIVGRNDFGTVSNSWAQFTYPPGDLGGIVGLNYGTVDHCDSSIITPGTDDARVVSYNQGGATLTNCVYNGVTQVTGRPYSHNFGTVTNCH